MGRSVHTSLKVLLLVVFGAAIGAAVPNDARAATSGLMISPTSVDTEIAPGASYKGEMLVVNQGESETSYKVYATPYSVSGEEYEPYFSPIEGATDISKWFTFGNTHKTLPAGNRDTIPFTITVPPGTGAGSYFATAFAETEDKGATERTGVVTRKRVGMVAYIRVSGKVKEEGSVAKWNVPWLQKAPLTATVKVANSGSVHFRSTVKVTVNDVFGGQKFVYNQEAEILPQKLRNMPIAWENGSTFGLFKVGGEVSYLNKKETLPTKFVFIANTPMRILMVSMLLLFVVIAFWAGKRVATKKK